MDVGAERTDEPAIARAIADATLVVGTQAEASTTQFALAIDVLAESVYAVCEAVPLRPEAQPADQRRARLYARRIHRYTQSVAQEIAILAAAQQDLKVTVQSYCEAVAAPPAGAGEEPQERLQSTLGKAIVAAKRAETAARNARGYLWRSIQVAIDAARISHHTGHASPATRPERGAEIMRG